MPQPSTRPRSQVLKLSKVTRLFQDYKWSILFITLLATAISYAYLYLTPSLYRSYAILKIKPKAEIASTGTVNQTSRLNKINDVKEEISLLQTFLLNQTALEKIEMQVQYYLKKEHKQIEIFKQNPIKLSHITILNDEIIGKELKLIPKGEGYTIQYTPSYQEKIRYALLNTKLFSFNTPKVLNYNREIETPYINFTMEKNSTISEPIYFIINPSQRVIFEKKIKKNLNIIQLDKDSSLIQVNYLDTLPDRAQIYVNTLIESFIAYNILKKNRLNSKTLTFIDKELQKIQQDLKISEAQLENYKINENVIEPSIKSSLLIKNLSEIEIKISENKLKKRLILNLINFVQNNDNLDAITPSVAKLNDQATLKLVSKLQAYQEEESKLIVEYTNEYPKLKNIRQQIKIIRKKIETNLKTLQNEINYQDNALLTRKNSDENSLKKLPSQERQLINMKRNYEVTSKMYAYLLEKKSERHLLKLANTSNYQIIDYAYNSYLPVQPKKTAVILTGTILGLFIGMLLAWIRSHQKPLIKNKHDIEELTSLPFYGSIPFYKHPRYELQVDKVIESPFIESFRTLRTNLQFIKGKNQSTTILITSMVASEGKTTISANLASILERAKYKTIVINLDLRKPSLHKYFDIINHKGMSTYLSGEDEIKDVIFSTEFSNLDVIPSGIIPENPSELIFSQRLTELLTYLKELYDYIIIDSAPIGIVMDTKTIVQYSDLNLIILRENYAEKNFILTIEEMIEAYQFKNIGFILNASKEKKGEYGYGYSYDYNNRE